MRMILHHIVPAFHFYANEIKRETANTPPSVTKLVLDDLKADDSSVPVSAPPVKVLLAALSALLSRLLATV